MSWTCCVRGLIERRRREAMEQIRLAVAELEPKMKSAGACLQRSRAPEKGGRLPVSARCEGPLRALEMISERSQRQLPPPTQNFKGIVGKEPYPVARKSGEVLDSCFCGVWSG